MASTLPRNSGNQGEESFPQAQLALELDSTLVSQHRSLKECVAARVYQQRGGVTAVAGKLDVSPSHLCEVLGGGGDRHRKFDLDELERYIASYGDVTPILYLVAKYMPTEAAQQQSTLDKLHRLLDEVPGLLAGLGVQQKRRR